MICHDVSWHIMIDIIILSRNIMKYHQVSPSITKCHHVSKNMVMFDDFWWQDVIIGDVSWHFLITKNVSKNMVTFDDMSWKFMTYQNLFREVGTLSNLLTFNNHKEWITIDNHAINSKNTKRICLVKTNFQTWLVNWAAILDANQVCCI